MTWSRALSIAASSVAVAACASVERPAPVRPAPVAEVAKAAAEPPAEAKLPFRLPCGDSDVEGCQKGCADAQREDCVTLATMYLRGTGVTADKDRAIGMFRVACNDGSARGCMRIGDAYHEGLVSGDVAEVDFYRRACEAGANQGCVAAGRAYLSGKGVGLDPTFAANLFDKVCARGNAEACLELGHQYRRGEGVKQSDARARDLFDKACKLGLDAGCVSASKDGSVLSPRD